MKPKTKFDLALEEYAESFVKGVEKQYPVTAEDKESARKAARSLAVLRKKKVGEITQTTLEAIGKEKSALKQSKPQGTIEVAPKTERSGQKRRKITGLARQYQLRLARQKAKVTAKQAAKGASSKRTKA